MPTPAPRRPATPARTSPTTPAAAPTSALTGPRTSTPAPPHRPSRRALVASGAWTMPVVLVSVAAPAYAASGSCTSPYRLDWGTTPYTKTTTSGTQTGTATVAATSGPGTAVTVTFTSTITGDVTRTSENLTVPNVTNIGNLGAGEKGLSLRHGDGHGSGVNNRQTVVITFSRAVTGLAFTITDIDSLNQPGQNDYWDAIILDGTRNAVRATHVTGTGTSGDPWAYDDNDTGVDDSSGAGNVAVSYVGSVTTITLTYYSKSSGAEERVFLSDFTFTAACT